jgi:cell wall assembly regulator SMI1
MIVEYWNEISSYISRFGLSLHELGFRTGTDRRDIAELEEELNQSLPIDYKEFLLLCNGQEFHEYDCYFHFLPTNMRFLGADEVVKIWKEQQQFVTEENINESWNWFQQRDTIRSVIFHPKRIPIADNEGVATLWIDNIPAPNGKTGQLITNYTECDFVVLANSMTHLLCNYALLIQKGILEWASKDKGYGEGFKLHCPNEKCFEGNEMAELYKKYGKDYFVDC